MSNQKLLSGLTVIDISQNLPGPYCSYLLQKLGARIIKVESPKKPDPAKYLPRFYEKLNNKKEIISIDLSSALDRVEFYELVKDADILIEGARPGVAKRLRVDFETLKQYAPKLVYCSISGYGQFSSKKHIPAHDINLQADAGLLSLSGNVQDSISVIPIADLTSSHKAYSEILAALIVQRSDHSQATFIDVSMGEALSDMVDVWKETLPGHKEITLQLNQISLTRYLPSVNPIRKWVYNAVKGELLSNIPHYGVFKCSDSNWITIGMVDERHFWISLCEEFGGIFKHFKTMNLKTRIILKPIIRMLISTKIRKKSSNYWLNKMQNLPVSLVR